jgi:hypothetical protein
MLPSTAVDAPISNTASLKFGNTPGNTESMVKNLYYGETYEFYTCDRLQSDPTKCTGSATVWNALIVVRSYPGREVLAAGGHCDLCGNTNDCAYVMYKHLRTDFNEVTVTVYVVTDPTMNPNPSALCTAERTNFPVPLYYHTIDNPGPCAPSLTCTTSNLKYSLNDKLTVDQFLTSYDSCGIPVDTIPFSINGVPLKGTVTLDYEFLAPASKPNNISIYYDNLECNATFYVQSPIVIKAAYPTYENYVNLMTGVSCIFSGALCDFETQLYSPMVLVSDPSYDPKKELNYTVTVTDVNGKTLGQGSRTIGATLQYHITATNPTGYVASVSTIVSYRGAQILKIASADGQQVWTSGSPSLYWNTKYYVSGVASIYKCDSCALALVGFYSLVPEATFPDSWTPTPLAKTTCTPTSKRSVSTDEYFSCTFQFELQIDASVKKVEDQPLQYITLKVEYTPSYNDVNPINRAGEEYGYYFDQGSQSIKHTTYTSSLPEYFVPVFKEKREVLSPKKGVSVGDPTITIQFKPFTNINP